MTFIQKLPLKMLDKIGGKSPAFIISSLPCQASAVEFQRNAQQISSSVGRAQDG